MNKKLIALLLATLPAAAMADVTLYGDIEASIENGKAYNYANGSDASHHLATINKVDDTGSYIGFKGNEDLGNGLKAIWQVEQGLNIDGTGTSAGAGNSYSGAFATRDTFVGLSGGFGTVKLGRNSTYLNSDMEKVDPWIYGAGVNGMSTLTFNDGRVNNSIRYDAPQFVPGLKLSALYGFDEQRNATKNDGSRANAGVYSLGIGYENSGFYGDLGYYGQLDQGNGSDHTAYYWRAEGGYNANNLLVALAYQETKAYLGSSVQVAGLNPSNFISEVPAGVGTAGGVKQNEFAITVGYTIGAFTPMASYSKGYDVKVDNYKVNDSGYDQWVIGSNYALSKRTNAYLSYGQKKWDSNIANVLGGGDKENTLAIGLQHKF